MLRLKKLDFEQNDAAQKTYTTKARKYKNTKFNKKKFALLFFRAHAAQAPALRVHYFVFSWLIRFSWVLIS